MSPSAGIPADAVAFYAELEANNTKDWWTANKERYEQSVREPFAALTDALADEFGEARIFRPYRDVRFSADKTPYKTEQGAIASAPGGAGYYVRLGSDGLVTGGGYMHGMPDQVARYRAALDAEGPVRSDGGGGHVAPQGIPDRRRDARHPAQRGRGRPSAAASSCATRASSRGATAGRRRG